MRELNAKEVSMASGGAVPLMAGGAVVGSVAYAGAVIAGQNFSWAELGFAVVGGALAPAAAAGASGAVAASLARMGWAEFAQSLNISFATGIMSGAISNQDQAGTNYGGCGTGYQ